MATVIYGSSMVFEVLPSSFAPGLVYSSSSLFVVLPSSFAPGLVYSSSSLLLAFPYPEAHDVTLRYKNKAWDSVAGEWVSWETIRPDRYGNDYPGPGVWGVDTSDQGVEAVVFGRYQR